jgi:hypothetical protein
MILRCRIANALLWQLLGPSEWYLLIITRCSTFHGTNRARARERARARPSSV